jgi:hypothetical protein
VAITRQETFVRDDKLPSWWANRLQDRIAGLTHFELRQLNDTTVEALAGADDESASLNIEGNWRFRESNVLRAHPGGAGGVYAIFVTAKAQDVVNVPAPNTDNTDYSFDLAIVADGAPPAIVAGTVDIFRRVGRLTWDGAKIVAGSLVQEVGKASAADVRLGAAVPIGGLLAVGGDDDIVTPEGAVFLLADGRLIDRFLYAAYFARVGHKYNLGVDPGSSKVKIADKRGRGIIGPDNMSGGRSVDPSTGVPYANPGAANRIPNSNRVAGQNGGEERHTLINGELPPRTVTSVVVAAGSDFNAQAAASGGGWNETGGLSGAHNNMQPYEVDNIFVRVA